MSNPIEEAIKKYLKQHRKADIDKISKGIKQDKNVVSQHILLMEERGLLRAKYSTPHSPFAYKEYYLVCGENKKIATQKRVRQVNLSREARDNL